VTGLYRAVELAPQDLPLRVLAAYQYLVDDNVEAARRMLQLIAHDSSAEALAARMRAVLDQLAQDGTAAAIGRFERDGLLAAVAGI
jgi:vacuolar-type H+-ATPase subunit E/Vma4